MWSKKGNALEQRFEIIVYKDDLYINEDSIPLLVTPTKLTEASIKRTNHFVHIFLYVVPRDTLPQTHDINKEIENDLL